MDERVALVGFIVAGLLLAIYGINGIVKRRITVFARGRMPRLCEGSEAVSYGVIVAVFGVGFTSLGAFLIYVSP
jgi:hypothetical protein